MFVIPNSIVMLIATSLLGNDTWGASDLDYIKVKKSEASVLNFILLCDIVFVTLTSVDNIICCTINISA